MYNQRRYGGSSSVRPSMPGRGSQSKSGSFRGSKSSSLPSRSHPSTPPTSKPQEQIKKEFSAKKEPLQNLKTEQLSGNTKRNEGRPTSASGAGKQHMEEAYIEADVIGFDCSVDQSAGEKPKVPTTPKLVGMAKSEQNKQEQKKDNSQPIKQYGLQNSRENSKRQLPSKSGTPQKVDGAQKIATKPEIIEDGFGLVRIGEKRLINIDSLILPQEKKHGGRSRLFVANLISSVSENDLRELFGKFGDPSEVFVNKDKGFGFVRLDYKVNADIAKNSLDGYMYKGRPLKVKFAAHQSAIEIHGIDRFTSNESLEAAFSQFGNVERATVICDERGRSKGYAVVEFAFKKSAQTALHRINEGLFVLGRLPKPVTAKPLSQTDDEGIHEKDLERIPGLGKDREYKARFLQPGTPEFAMAKQWRELEEEGLSQQKRLEEQLEDDQHKMEYEFEANLHDQEAEYIRQELLQKQAAIEEEIRRYDEMRSRESLFLRQQGKNFDRRQSDYQDGDLRGMSYTNPNVGLNNLNPEAALALAANNNILQQTIKGQDSMGGGNQGMQRMPGPRGGGNLGGSPRGHGMMGHGGMPQPRPLFDGRQNPPQGNLMPPGTRRPGSRDNLPNNNNSKRPRK